MEKSRRKKSIYLGKGNWFMKSKLERFSKPELEFFIDNCNFSKDEIIILNMASTGFSEIKIAREMNFSESSVTKKKRHIIDKMNDFVEELENMTTIYVNGKRVTKDELRKYEIKIENVKKILSEKLTKSK